jgi:hypothetical protein
MWGVVETVCRWVYRIGLLAMVLVVWAWAITTTDATRTGWALANDLGSSVVIAILISVSLIRDRWNRV